MLAIIVTYCERSEIEVNNTMKQVATSPRILPQGSPASPMITNIICRGMDEKLHDLSVKNGASYSRYADDMSFAFPDSTIFKTVGKFLFEACSTVENEGFRVHPNKTKFSRKSTRQCITGIVINNDEIGVTKEWMKKMRAAVHRASVMQSKGETPDNLGQIAGMCSWISSVNSKRYEKLIAEAKKVLEN